MKLGFTSLALLTGLAAGLLSTPVHAQGFASCAGRPLQGAYAMRQSGLLYLPALALPNGDAPRIAGVGIATFDGRGTFSIVAGANSFGGHIVINAPAPITGTYTLNANCSGTIAFNDVGGPESIFFVMADGGNRLLAIYTTPTGPLPGPVVSVEFVRQ